MSAELSADRQASCKLGRASWFAREKKEVTTHYAGYYASLCSREQSQSRPFTQLAQASFVSLPSAAFWNLMRIVVWV